MEWAIGVPIVLVALLCPLMMVGMAAFMWFGARLGFRRLGHGATTGEGGHDGHMMCGPMGHGSHGSHEAPRPAEDEVTALRARVEALERRASETRTVGRSH